MRAKEFDVAWKIAQSGMDLTEHDDSPLHGCGLPEYQGARVNLFQVARLLRWQCIGMDGVSIDHNELADMRWRLVRRGKGELVQVEMTGEQARDYLAAICGEVLGGVA